MPSFPFTEVKSVRRWTNYSGSLPERGVPLYCTPDVVGVAGAQAPRKLRRHGDSLKAILEHCFATPASSLRAIGSRWSFSNILQPEILVVDPANLNVMLKVREDWLSQSYRQRRPAPGFTPMFVQGGARVASVNRRLLDSGLALQTSGSGDGHRVAGCLATGTHGSALGIGAVHDTLLGMHLIVGPNDSVFVQPEPRVFQPEVAEWLEHETGIPTRDLPSNELFAAAQVSLGSLGFVQGVMLETVPIYSLRGRVLNRSGSDPDVWRTLEDLDTRRFHPDVAERPYHFEVVLHPYPRAGAPGAYLRMFWKASGGDAPHDSPLPTSPDLASDKMGLIAHLSTALAGPLTTLAVQLAISSQLENRFRPRELAPQVPGMVFGPTGLPPGSGASTEVIVPPARVRQALELLFGILDAEAAQGRHLLGPVALRFVPKTQALLGMNQHDMNCFIELPSIRTDEVLGIYRAWWNALEHANIAFGCHWGQLHGMTRARTQSYYGDRATRWKAARDELLPSPEARRVFSSLLLADVGLD